MNDAPQTQAEKEGLAQAAAATGEGSTGKEKTSRYTIQMAVYAEIRSDEVEICRAPDATGLWQDVLTVEVPVRSQRKTAVLAALEQLKIPQDEEHYPLAFRAIDDEAGEIFPVVLEQPPAPAPVVKVG